MIRAVFVLFSVALVLCAFIVVRPFSDRTVQADLIPSVPVEAQVTRAAAPADPVAVDAASDASSTAAVLASIAQPAPAGQLNTDESSMQEMTSGVLASLGIAATDPQDSALRDQTALALAGIRQATGQDTGDLTPQNALQSLVTQALREGQSDDYIDMLVNEAARAGDVSVPEILVTADGRVDTFVLLNAIVTQAGVAAGEPAPLAPETAGGEGVEVRVVQRVDDTAQYRFYTIGPGDSLGAIAVKFYGDISYFEAIYDANRAILSSPDMLHVGQRLVIPDLG